jgi:hypothetical protein
MKSSTYLIRFKRLLVLGAVVAGIAVPAAGAYNGSPPDVRDAANSVAGTNVSPPDVRDVAANLATATQSFVVTPPDVRDAADTLNSTAQGLKADGLRLQGIAQVYKDLAAAQNFPTAQGIKADGLRLQGIAQVYKEIGSTSVPDVFERYAAAHPYGAGLSNATSSTLVSPPDVRDVAATLAGTSSVDVMNRHFNHEDAIFGNSPSLSVLSNTGSGDSFNWGDWAIGIGSGIGLMLLLAGALAGERQRRHMQTA